MNKQRKQQGKCKSDRYHYKLSSYLAVGMIIVIACIAFYIKEHPLFIRPSIEVNQVAGEPQGDLGEGFQGLALSEKFQFGVQADLKFIEDHVDIYLVNDVGNEILLQARVIDANGEIIAESGVVEPGYYLKSMSVKRTITEEEPVSLEVLGYDLDTYYSAGKVGINTVLYPQ